MLLSEIKKLLNCNYFSSEDLLKKDIKYCFAADLMSDVLKYARTGSLLMTGLTSNQILQVAEILDLSGIVFVRGKIPDKDIISVAEARKIPLLSTKLLLFDSCGILYKHGLHGGKSSLIENDESKSSIKPIIHN
jgi:predicted transcriptional regulator